MKKILFIFLALGLVATVSYGNVETAVATAKKYATKAKDAVVEAGRYVGRKLTAAKNYVGQKLDSLLYTTEEVAAEEAVNTGKVASRGARLANTAEKSGQLARHAEDFEAGSAELLARMKAKYGG